MSLKYIPDVVVVIALALGMCSPLAACSVRRDLTLTYPNGESSRERVRIRHAGGEREFQLWLAPDRDELGNVVNLTVSMSCAGCSDEENLMYDRRPLHGAQSFMFLASQPADLYRRREVRLISLGARILLEGRDFDLCRGASGRTQFCRASVSVRTQELR